jgi:hypothetical protein
MHNRFTFAPALLLFISAIAAASDDADHPLISRYPGAQVRKAYSIDYEPFQIPASIVIGSSKPYKYATIDTKGKLTRHAYIVKDVSSLKVYENYLAAIKKLGFTVTFSCQLEACGTQDQACSNRSASAQAESVHAHWYREQTLLPRNSIRAGTQPQNSCEQA